MVFYCGVDYPWSFMAEFSPDPVQVVLVEDEADLREEIVFQLNHHGLEAHGCSDAKGLYRFLCAHPRAMIVLDIGLPDEDGISICRYLRDANPLAPIVIASARADRQDRINGLAAGADAYLCKPFDIEELVLTLKRLHERSIQWLGADQSSAAAQPRLAPMASTPAQSTGTGLPIASEPSQLPSPSWRFDAKQMMLIAPNDERVRLSVVELRIMLGLIKAAGSVCNYHDLIPDQDPIAETCDTHRLEVIISRLRGKSARVAGEPLPIETVRGRGYRLHRIAVL